MNLSAVQDPTRPHLPSKSCGVCDIMCICCTITTHTRTLVIHLGVPHTAGPLPRPLYLPCFLSLRDGQSMRLLCMPHKTRQQPSLTKFHRRVSWT